MKSSMLVIIGATLLLGGGYVLLKGGHITTRRQVMEVGGMSISTEQNNAIEPWVAGVALVAGTVLVLFGLTKKF